MYNVGRSRWTRSRTTKITIWQSRKRIMVFSILPKNERNSLSWVKKMLRIMSFVCFLEEFRTLEIAFEIYWPLAFFPEKAMVLLGAFDPPNALGALVLGKWWFSDGLLDILCIQIWHWITKGHQGQLFLANVFGFCIRYRPTLGGNLYTSFMTSLKFEIILN